MRRERASRSAGSRPRRSSTSGWARVRSRRLTRMAWWTKSREPVSSASLSSLRSAWRTVVSGTPMRRTTDGTASSARTLRVSRASPAADSGVRCRPSEARTPGRYVARSPTFRSIPPIVVVMAWSPSRPMRTSARSRRSCPATGSVPRARIRSRPVPVNVTWDAPSSRFMSAKESSTSPRSSGMRAPRTEVGPSPSRVMSRAVADTEASVTRSAATSGTVTFTASRCPPTSWGRKGKPSICTSGAADSFIRSLRASAARCSA